MPHDPTVVLNTGLLPSPRHSKAAGVFCFSDCVPGLILHFHLDNLLPVIKATIAYGITYVNDA